MATEIEETLMTFPCRFPLKVMGANHPEFDIHMLSAIKEHDPHLTEEDICLRASAKGNYISATVTVNAVSQEQLDAIYQMLCDHSMVKMVF